MIDTIVLTLSSDQFQITHPEKFSPHASLRGVVSKQNPIYKERVRASYKPRLTLSPSVFAKQSSPRLCRPGASPDRQEQRLRIELSLPKLMYGNNLEELQYKDFRTCAQKLSATLHTMGVRIPLEALENAHVSAIHYSKNIPLTDGSTPYHYINKIKEANVKLALDINQTDYRNDGYSYRWHCKSYEVIFYDKLRDLKKDATTQKNLGLPLLGKKKFEVLRMEVRLNKRTKIKQLFQTLNIKTELTFNKLFKPSIAKKVLLHYIDELERTRPPLIDYKPLDDRELLSTLLVNNPDLSPKRIAQIYGLKKMLEVFTLRELRTRFGKNSRSWLRLITEAQHVRLPIVGLVFSDVRRCVERMKAIKL